MAALDPDTARIDIGTALSAVWRRMPRIIGVTLALLALTYAVLLFVPKMYESSATILVESRDSIFLRASEAGSSSSTSSGSVSDDMAIESQVELIQSRDTLLSVIEAADLAAAPELTNAPTGLIGLVTGLFGQTGSKRNVTEIILSNMVDRLTVIRERDSRIISVLFRSESPALAAKVANAIAAAHVNRRAGLEIADTADATQWLSIEIDKLRQKVADAEAKVANFRIEHDLYQAQEGKSNLTEQQLSDIATQITQSQERQSTAESRVNVLRALIKAGKPINSVDGVQESVTIQKLVDVKSDLQSQKAEMLARLLPTHPSVVSITAQIAEIDKQIAAEGWRIADAFDSSAEIEAKIQTSLREQMTQLKATASGDLTAGVTLAELEREAKSERDLFETYLARFRDASARTDSRSALPDVRVVSEAAPSVEPASPKTTLILIAVAVVALAGQVGFILFGELVSGRAIVEGVPQAFAADRPAKRHVEPLAEPLAEASAEPEALPDVFDDPPAAWAEPSISESVEARSVPQAEQAAPVAVDPVAAILRPLAPQPQHPPQPVANKPAPDTYSMWEETALPVAEAAAPMRQVPHRPAPPRRLPETLIPLVDAIAAGRERVVLVISHGETSFSLEVLELIGGACSARGLGMATIDAASGRTSPNAGLGDLLVGAASFGDVVHADRKGQLARVPWGQQERLDHRSAHGITLAEALSDIYNVVLIAAGPQGLNSSLPIFAGIDGYVVVASDQTIDGVDYAGLEADAAALGFHRVQVVSSQDDAFQVA